MVARRLEIHFIVRYLDDSKFIDITCLVTQARIDDKIPFRGCNERLVRKIVIGMRIAAKGENLQPFDTGGTR